MCESGREGSDQSYTRHAARLWTPTSAGNWQAARLQKATELVKGLIAQLIKHWIPESNDLQTQFSENNQSFQLLTC